ncbi:MULTISPECIES: hypothetical protein [unclassified Mycobacterium]|uniref:hypothetical protein n=1 Tax=unclassified Mycobacterium TaxID=2642494 RepID=UPI0029C5FEC9|nr:MULTISPECIES: hypothetical protein [unclassified Mycobacterium]
MSSHSDETPDTVLPVLTRSQAHDFHATLGRVLGQHRLEYRWNGDDSYTVDGVVFGLANLAAVVAREPAEEWTRHIDRHVSGFMALREDPTPKAELSIVYPRVRLARGDTETDYPVRGMVDGLEVVLALDHPHVVSELESLEYVADLGPWPVLWAAAMENLRALPDPHHEIVDVERDHGALPLHAFQFEDYFGPSRILMLREFVRPYFPNLRSGLLVAIPDRHTVLAVVVDDGALVACGELAAIAQNLFETSPGAITPSVYYLGSDDSVSMVAYLTEDGSTYVKPTAELAEVILGAN